MNQLPMWMDRAACRRPGVRPEWFTPVTGPEGAQAAEAARHVCADCPVTEQCLEFALACEGNERSGVFGGLSARQRRSLMAARRRAGR